MTERELNKSLSEGLKSAGLSRYLVREQCQLSEVPEGFFVETVLSDGSKLEEAENVIASIRAEVEAQGTHLICILRAIWSVKEVEKLGPSWGKSGGLKSSKDFRAVLESGRREAEVVVEVTVDALKELQEKLGSDDQMLEAVAEFLRLQLSWGGAGYWDPIRYPKPILNGPAASYLLAHRAVTTV
jgi:hypothetical protein